MKKQSTSETFELVKDIFTDENKKGIADVTPLLPEIIAEGITQDKTEIEYLVNRAEIHFQNSDHFKKSITKPGNKGYIGMFSYAITRPVLMKEAKIKGEANAAFIVKACNNHNALVKALTTLVNWHQAHDPISFIEANDLKEATQLLNKIQKESK